MMNEETTQKRKYDQIEKVEEGEEDDYMLMDLETLESKVPKKTDLTYSERRRHKLNEQKIKGYNKSSKEEQKEKLVKALNEPIKNTNIGFRLLQKMGFKEGNALGKEGGAGLVEPIKIDIKSGVEGIGVEREEKEKKMKLAKAKDYVENVKKEDFQTYTKSIVQNKLDFADWNKAKAVCEQLDRAKGIDNNPFWSPFSHEKKYEKARLLKENNELSIVEKVEETILEIDNVEVFLEELLNYLRTNYYYCLYCGEKYRDWKDLSEHCPGVYRDDH